MVLALSVRLRGIIGIRVVKQVVDAISVLEGKVMEVGVRTVGGEDDGLGGLIPRGAGEFLVLHHFGGNSVHGVLREVELRDEGFEFDRFVEVSVGEEVGAKGFFLDFAFEHHLDVVSLGDELPNIEREEE